MVSSDLQQQLIARSPCPFFGQLGSPILTPCKRRIVSAANEESIEMVVGTRRAV